MSRSRRRHGKPKKQKYNYRKPNRTARKSRQHQRPPLYKNRHHLRNKCRGGDFSPENIIWLKVWKHNLWHKVFKNSDPVYIIKVLERMMRMKGYKKEGNDE